MAFLSRFPVRGGLFGALAFATACWAAPAAAVVIDSQIVRLSANTSSVDRVRFDVTTAGNVTFDLLSWEQDLGDFSVGSGTWTDLNGDGEAAFFDTFIRLFVDDGSLDTGDEIAANNDSATPGSDGSIVFNPAPAYYDSFLTVHLDPGSYILAVGGRDLSSADAVLGVNSDSLGGYSPYRCVAGANNCSAIDQNDHGDYRIAITGDAGLANVRADAQLSVPEPGALALLGFGLAGFGFARRRARR